MTTPSNAPGVSGLMGTESMSDANALPVACTTEGCHEEAEFDVIETVFGVDLPRRPVCLSCAGAMGLRGDVDV